jgi:hypothetical protein
LSQNLDVEFGKRFLVEALPLVASYLSGENVKLTTSDVTLGEESDAESQLFANQIRLRHAIACCTELILIVHQIEEKISSVSRMIRTETRGVIRGRLDIPKYVARRSSSLSWPKSYPILVSEDSPSTPENLLMARVFRHMLYRLATTNLPPRTAEVLSARWFRNWISSRLKREPWVNINANASLQRLHLETSRRISRRQTGNDRAYSNLLNLIEDWQLLSLEHRGATSSDKYVDALLSFPADEAFLNRIYEIWCIREIAAILSGNGAMLVEGPAPMTESRQRPIYVFQIEQDRIEIWFQRALIPESATWSYESTGKNLRGIPDITIIANGTYFLLIDAKNRLVTGNTRSEETYKMLGYFENFRPLFSNTGNWGVLAFVSYNGFFQSLASSPPGRKIVMLSADPKSALQCNFKAQFSKILHDWFEQWRHLSTHT